MTRTAFKLLTLRKDNSLGPLFINKRQVIEVGRWYNKESHPTKGYQNRPGWHVAPYPFAPHLSIKGRVWCEVEVEGITVLERPLRQGGEWWLCDRMRVMQIMRQCDTAADAIRPVESLLLPTMRVNYEDVTSPTRSLTPANPEELRRLYGNMQKVWRNRYLTLLGC